MLMSPRMTGFLIASVSFSLFLCRGSLAKDSIPKAWFTAGTRCECGVPPKKNVHIHWKCENAAKVRVTVRGQCGTTDEQTLGCPRGQSEHSVLLMVHNPCGEALVADLIIIGIGPNGSEGTGTNVECIPDCESHGDNSNGGGLGSGGN